MLGSGGGRKEGRGESRFLGNISVCSPMYIFFYHFGLTGVRMNQRGAREPATLSDRVPTPIFGQRQIIPTP